MNELIELIVRGVLLDSGHILLVHRKETSNIFLPGGHIEKGETARDALLRELEEELGVGCGIAEFLGILEHTYSNEDDTVHEINLLFCITMKDKTATSSVRSREEHLEFLWLLCKEDVLEKHNLQPWILHKYLPLYCQQGSFPGFLSTMRGKRAKNRKHFLTK